MSNEHGRYHGDLNESSSTPEGDSALRRDLGLLQVSLGGIGLILGAGIYALIGQAAAESGSLVWLTFVITAVVAAFTGLSYAELAAMHPKAGGSYEYARQAFGLRIGFVTGWLVVCAEIIGAGAVALGFGAYLEALMGPDAGLSAIVLLGVAAVIAATGVLGSMRLAGLLTLVEAGGLVLVTAIGFLDFSPHRAVADAHTGQLLSGAGMVFFAYIGFEQIATFSEETRDPRRTIPRAILISIAFSTALYVLVALSAVGSIGADALAEAEAPLAAVAEQVLGAAAGDVMSSIALAATANTALLLLMAGGRHVYAMASTGALPRQLGYVSGRSRIPLAGIAVASTFAILISLWGDIGAIAETTSFGLLAAFVVVNAALIFLRRSRANAARAAAPTEPVVRSWRSAIPLIPLLGLTSSLVLMSSLTREALVGGVIVLALGVVFALFVRGGRREDPL